MDGYFLERMPLHGFGFVVLSNTVKSNCEEETTPSQVSDLKSYNNIINSIGTHKRMAILKRRLVQLGVELVKGL